MGNIQKLENSSSVVVVPDNSSPTTSENVGVVSYVVVRDGFRVSGMEYGTSDDPIAASELEFWTRVEKNHSWGAPVSIVKYDPKRHRTW